MVEAACIQIAARMAPHVDGVGDYAMQVARVLRQLHGVTTRFVACSLRESDDRVVDGFPIHVVKAHSAQALAQCLERLMPVGPVRLLYHLSGYGYSPDGAPAWLVEGLRLYMRVNPQARLATVFHELYATAMPWRRAFWHSPRQRRVARDLAHMSDHGLCTLERNQRVLGRWAPDLALTRLAIPSNIRPAQVWVPWSERSQHLAIFGLPGSRIRAYAAPQTLQRLCRDLGVTHIRDIGPALPRYPVLAGVHIEPLGVIAEAQVSQQLMGCRFGYLDYSTATLAKSGVMAAYCAHGLVPVIPAAGTQPSDALQINQQYLAADSLGSLEASQLPAIAERARQWYGTHDVPAHAHWYYARLMD